MAQGGAWVLTTSRLHICIMMQMSDLATAGVVCLFQPLISIVQDWTLARKLRGEVSFPCFN